MVAIFSAPKHSANAEKANKRRMTANAFDRREQYLSEQNVSLLPPKNEGETNEGKSDE
ncbi:hypothetical protein ACDY97_13835 [Rhizobium mongolense]|uniref:hypothetical protein n=1 Tax=Rhizobium TaxID=379 RepID=UPI0012EC37D6|nr:hypothetical protein [Rhizobium gallicum]ULJ74822.1 hypothetical protein L2W42_31325 [Rhizobium gallicum]